jgi:endonuclease-3 related protein
MGAATCPALPTAGDRTAPRNAPERLRLLYDALLAAYGPQHWWPSETAVETVVGAYLTQNTSWRNVERSIANLAAAGVLSVDGLRAVDLETLRMHIRPSGYMVRKALAIKAFIVLLDAQYGGSLAQLAATPTGVARDALLGLPGVGPETADAILLYALGQPVMVVDEYLRRVATRHGLIDEKARYADLQQLAVAAFRGEPLTGEPMSALLAHYNEFHALIVEVGKQHCGGVARCAGCPLNQPQFGPPPTPSAAPRRATRRAPAPLGRARG